MIRVLPETQLREDGISAVNYSISIDINQNRRLITRSILTGLALRAITVVCTSGVAHSAVTVKSGATVVACDTGVVLTAAGNLGFAGDKSFDVLEKTAIIPITSHQLLAVFELSPKLVRSHVKRR